MNEMAQSKPQNRIFYGWILVAAIWIIVVVSAGIFISFGVFLNPLLPSFGWTHPTVSLAYSIFMLTGGIGTLTIGGLVERYSIRKILLIGGLMHAAGIMLTATTRELWQLYLFYGVLASLGRSTFNISYVTLVNRWCHGSRCALMLTTFLQAAFILWLMNAAAPIVFFLFAVCWGFGYAGVTMQYGIIAQDVFPTDLRGPAFAGVSCAAMIGMAAGGYLGGLLYDISHTYITAWWVSLFTGLIAALIAMEMARKAEHEKLMDAATAESIDTLSDPATEMAVQSKTAQS
jgi:predicted MFS family arabinose efflux permease